VDSNYNVKLFFSYGRKSKLLDIYQSHMGRTSVAHLENYFGFNKISNVIALSDKHISYKSFFIKNDIEHHSFISKKHIDYGNKFVHNQTLNAYVKNFKEFVNSYLKGVSTKYLPYYAKWFQFLCNIKTRLNRIDIYDELSFDIFNNICNKIVNNTNSLEIYRQTEYSFKNFLHHNNRTNYGNCKNHYYSKIAA
jgi:hypothetical protein